MTEVLQRAAAERVPAKVVGETGGNRLRIAVAGRLVVDLSVDELERLWSSAIEQHFVRQVRSGFAQCKNGQVQGRVRRLRHLRSS